jgi:hypothetical protein
VPSEPRPLPVRPEEELTDKVRVHRPIKAAVEMGETISVGAGRDRPADETLTATIEERLRSMLPEFDRDCRPYSGV